MAVTLVQDNTLQYKVPTSIELYDSSYQTSDLTNIYNQILSVAENVFSNYYPCIVFPQTFLSINLNNLNTSYFSDYVFPLYFYLGCYLKNDAILSSDNNLNLFTQNLSAALSLISSINFYLNYCFIGSRNYFVYSNIASIYENTIYRSPISEETGNSFSVYVQSFNISTNQNVFSLLKTKLIYIFKIEYNNNLFDNIFDSLPTIEADE